MQMLASILPSGTVVPTPTFPGVVISGAPAAPGVQVCASISKMMANIKNKLNTPCLFWQ